MDQLALNVIRKLEIDTLDWKNYDHRAIILGSSTRKWGPKPIKFSDCWLAESSLFSSISKNWM